MIKILRHLGIVAYLFCIQASQLYALPDTEINTAIIHFQMESEDSNGQKVMMPSARRYCDFKNKKFRQDMYLQRTKSWVLEKLAISDIGYTVNNINNTAMKIDDFRLDPASILLLYYTKTPLRVDQVAGQDCNVYTHSKQEVCLWKGIPIRTKGKLLGVNIYSEVSKIEINPVIKDEIFNLPDGMKEVSVTRGLIDSVTQMFSIGQKLKKKDPKIMEKIEDKLLEFEGKNK